MQNTEGVKTGGLRVCSALCLQSPITFSPRGEVLAPSGLTVPRKIVPGHAHSLEERICSSSPMALEFGIRSWISSFDVGDLDAPRSNLPADRVRAAPLALACSQCSFNCSSNSQFARPLLGATADLPPGYDRDYVCQDPSKVVAPNSS
jgi:hypothetical protein